MCEKVPKNAVLCDKILDKIFMMSSLFAVINFILCQKLKITLHGYIPKNYKGNKIMKEIAKLFCEKFCVPDSEAFSKLFTENAVYVDSLYGEYKGKEAIKKFHMRCHQEAKEYIFIPKNIISEGNKIAFEWELEFTLNTPFAIGKRIKVHGASFISIEDKKINTYREYSDSIAILLKGDVPDNKIIRFYRKKYQEK